MPTNVRTYSCLCRPVELIVYPLVHAMQSKISLHENAPAANVMIIDYAIANKLTPFIAMQNHYNLVYREEEREMMPTLKVASHCPLRACPMSSELMSITSCSSSVLVQFLGVL